MAHSHALKQYLLLLPPCDQPSDIEKSYSKSILEVLEILAEHPGAAVLDIAVAYPHLVGSEDTPRQAHYAKTEALVAGVYRLICTTATRLSLDIEDENGCDIRVLLVAWSPDVQSSVHSSAGPRGPVIGLETLARSQRPWATAFGDESAQGEAFFRAFTEARDHDHSSCGGCHGSHGHDHTPTVSTDPSGADMDRLYKVAVGGTFDHLHLGHKLLLTMTAFALDYSPNSFDPSTLIVGISGADLLKSKKYAEYLESWQQREGAVFNFLKGLMDFHSTSENNVIKTQENNGPALNDHTIVHRFPRGLTVECVEIADSFGPTVTDADVSGLVLSAETRAGGKSINDKRTGKGWKSLKVFEVDVLEPTVDGVEATMQTKAQEREFHSKLSSTAIRERLSRATDASG